MTDVVLTPAAQADVDEIWSFTAEHWSEAQAATYVEGLRDACRELASPVDVSRPVDVRPGYRKVAVGAHVIYFRVDDGARIVVVRILHQRMDVERHL